MVDNRIDWPVSGRYILAVSGGADSMVLLTLMANSAKERSYELIVAHFDHGIRTESSQDRKFVERAAQRHKLQFVYTEAHLGNVSEAAARTARHSWLEKMRKTHCAKAVITAHHEDDIIETSILNLARGTSRRGLAPMRGSSILRPLIGVSRNHLRSLAENHNVEWREDATNTDIANPRNFLRHNLLGGASPDWRALYLESMDRISTLNTKIDQNISILLSQNRESISSYLFSRKLIYDLSLKEVEDLLVGAATSLEPGVELDRRGVGEVALFVKSSAPHHKRPLRKNLLTTVQTDSVRVYYMGISKVGRR
ncbi:MAG TPA: tRNA lysidine(34) synthetase TilS [Candidatus Saccharimonadia bacterium]|nr:tRNA lysidine(34) synthetase TilS [Candidatus Saccharimonadia bacterium]